MRRILVVLIAVLVGFGAPGASADWHGIGGMKEHRGAASTDGAAPLSLLHRAAESSAIVTPTVATAGIDPSRATLAYGTADGRIHRRRVLSGAVVGPAEGVLVDTGTPDADVFGTPQEGGGTTAPVFGGGAVLHNDGDHISLATISAAGVVDNKAIPGTTGMTIRSAPLVTDHCKFLGSHAPRGVEALYFVAGERLFRLPAEWDGSANTVSSVAVPGANPLATPGVLAGCNKIVVSRDGGLSLFDGATLVNGFYSSFGVSLEGQTAQEVPLDPGRTFGTPTSLYGTHVLLTETDGASTWVLAVDPAQSPAIVARSPALPGTPGPALATTLTSSLDRGIAVVGTSDNLYVLNPALGEVGRLSPAALPHDQAFATVAPSLAGHDGVVRINVQRADGTPMVLDAGAIPLPASDFTPPEAFTSATDRAVGQPVAVHGAVIFTAAHGVAVYRDHDVTAPDAEIAIYDGDGSPYVSGRTPVDLYVTDRQPATAVVRATSASGGTPIVIATFTADADGGPWVGAPLTDEDTFGGPYRSQHGLSWDSTSVLDGTYHLDVVLTDAAGNTATVKGNDFTVRNHPPVAAPPTVLKPGACANLRTGRSIRERLVGTTAGDRIRGMGGNDSISGGRGADCLEGNNGNDRLHGDAGNDRLLGGAGNDILDGGSGANIISGGSGNDTITATNRAKDYVTCGPGRDTVRADRRDHVAKNCERVRRAR